MNLIYAGLIAEGIITPEWWPVGHINYLDVDGCTFQVTLPHPGILGPYMQMSVITADGDENIEIQHFDSMFFSPATILTGTDTVHCKYMSSNPKIRVGDPVYVRFK
jgi:hypothetical protein